MSNIFSSFIMFPTYQMGQCGPFQSIFSPAYFLDKDAENYLLEYNIANFGLLAKIEMARMTGSDS